MNGFMKGPSALQKLIKHTPLLPGSFDHPGFFQGAQVLIDFIDMKAQYFFKILQGTGSP
jgi:hypothetical protein